MKILLVKFWLKLLKAATKYKLEILWKLRLFQLQYFIEQITAPKAV